MPRVKWVMLCPMARSGSSHTSELLCRHKGIWSHHGLFNNGPMGRWPSKEHIPGGMNEYYSAILDDNYTRVGGEERSGEFLDKYIFTDDSRFNPRQWECVGFKVQYVHLVNMPDLRDYLVRQRDIKIILNTRRDLLEHTAAEWWCNNGNSRAARPDTAYAYGDSSKVWIPPEALFATFRNLCRYRYDARATFDRECFFEWSLEDMFIPDGGVNEQSHCRLFDFLEMKPSEPFASTFSRTPRPRARDYISNLAELNEASKVVGNGVFEKYFAETYDPRRDTTWPVLDDYSLGSIMRVKDNADFRARQ